jgi:hypothetical protein
MIAVMTSKPARTGGLRFLSALLGVLAVSSCGIRAEEPPPSWPTPDAVTLARDEAASRERALLDALASGAEGPTKEVTAFVRGAAEVHLTALGGVYVPFPSASPSPDDVAPLGFAQAVEQARDGQLAQCLAGLDQDLDFIACSAGLSHALALARGQSTQTPEADYPPAAIAPFTSPALTSTDTSPADATWDAALLSQLALAHDEARFAYETAAARAAEAERDYLLARRDIHAARAASLLSLDSVEDSTDSVYDIRTEQVSTTAARAATLHAIESALGWTYAAALADAPGQERSWLINGAFDSYMASINFPDFGLESVPALPGIDPSTFGD